MVEVGNLAAVVYNVNVDVEVEVGSRLLVESELRGWRFGCEDDGAWCSGLGIMMMAVAL